MAREESIVSVDPGLNNPATALFRHGVLLCASRIKPDKTWKDLDVAERCRLIGDRIYEYWATNGDRQMVQYDRLVIEWPQVYSAGKSKGDPNDLLPLVGVAMSLAGRLWLPVTSYKPAQWIGQVPKKETGDPLDSPRGRLVWRNLTDQERERVVVSHDAIDAIGIGLHHLGRLHRRVYPDA